MANGSGKCGCTKCIRRKRKKRVESALIAEMAYQHRIPQEETAPIAEEDNKSNLEAGQVNELNEQEHSQFRQQTDLIERAWWTDMTHRVYMPPLMLQKPTRSECSSATSGLKTARPETPDPPSSSSSSVISITSDYKSCENSVSHLDLRSKSLEEMTKNLKTKPELPVVRSASMLLGHQPNPKPKELRELQMIASRRKKIANKKRPVCRTTSHATDSFSNCVKCSKIVSRPFRKIKHRFTANYHYHY